MYLAPGHAQSMFMKKKKSGDISHARGPFKEGDIFEQAYVTQLINVYCSVLWNKIILFLSFFRS